MCLGQYTVLCLVGLDLADWGQVFIQYSLIGRRGCVDLTVNGSKQSHTIFGRLGTIFRFACNKVFNCTVRKFGSPISTSKQLWRGKRLIVYPRSLAMPKKVGLRRTRDIVSRPYLPGLASQHIVWIWLLQRNRQICPKQLPGNERLSKVCDPNGRGHLANETKFSFIAWRSNYSARTQSS